VVKMALENVKLSQLRTLVTVAEYGNFSEAALRLGISQSAVSHAIATLEDELGVILLSRGRHGAILTPVGERVIDHAQEVLQLLEVIGKEANLSKGLQGGQVRIASFRSAATHVLPGVIAQFRKCFPAIAVTIREDRGDEGVEQSLREGRADIGLSCLPPSPGFESWELLRDEYVVLLPPGIKALGSRITWDELAAHPLIMPPSGDSCSMIIRDYLSQMERSINATYEIQEDSTIVSMVMQGLGATIMARLAAEPLPPEMQVCHLPVPLERVIRVIMLENALHPPAVYAFLDILKKLWQSGKARVPVNVA
jgi:DNA-binding transcriptional LysR family regulator